MPGFSFTPGPPAPEETEGGFPIGLQWRFQGEDVGTAGQFDVIDIVQGDTLNVSAGTGETSNVLTIMIPWGSGVSFP